MFVFFYHQVKICFVFVRGIFIFALHFKKKSGVANFIYIYIFFWNHLLNMSNHV